MKFELIGKIESIEITAVGGQIRDLQKLRKKHGKGRWRKLKGIGRVRLPDGSECDAEFGTRRMGGQERDEGQRAS